jgi:hypothetical protein
VTRNRLIAPSGNLHQNTLFLGLKDFPLRCENPTLKDHLILQVSVGAATSFFFRLPTKTALNSLVMPLVQMLAQSVDCGCDGVS